MNEDRAQLLERLQQANNVLITVNSNPTVDQLAACIGFTILLNKLSKHATAVFSGSIPSTLEFLKPEETLEKNTDSLRDFIIALDKSKADKLRYKVEDTMVKIFITPYKTSISDADLEFSQGDFNVDVVLALGVHEREQVDKVIMAHGRILHDAVVMTADTKAGNNIGTINWVNEQASSLCEMLASIVEELKPQSLDAQIATALLTGIVAETERFRNQKTSSSTMEVSSKLMAAGADQQLVASKLEPEVVIPKTDVLNTDQPQPETPVDENDGAMVIDHTDESQNDQELPPVDFGDDESFNQIRIDDHGTLKKKSEWLTDKKDSQLTDGKNLTNDKSQTSKMVFEPPTMGGTLTANSKPEQFDPSTDPLSVTNGDETLIARTSESSSSISGSGIPTKLSDVISQSTSLKTAIGDNQTLEEIEEVVKDQEAASVTSQPTIEDIENARGAVNYANLGSDSTKPIAGLNAQPIDLELGHDEANNNVDSSTGSSQTSETIQTDKSAQDASTDVSSTDAPPPVPPPMMPPFNSPSTTSPQ